MEIVCHIWCLVICFSYVFSLYLVPSKIQLLPRDDPLHMKYRMGCATGACIFCSCLVFFILAKDNVMDYYAFGSFYSMAASIMTTILLMTIFYTGAVRMLHANCHV